MPKAQAKKATKKEVVEVSVEKESSTVISEEPKPKKKVSKKKKEDPAPEPEPAPAPVENKKKSTGMRSAVRLGEISATDALKELKKKYSWLNPDTQRWYEQRAKRENAS